MTSAGRRLWNDDDGVTAAEYALMLSMVAVATVIATTALKSQVIAAFNAGKAAFGG
jgi:Flp pilus assembly pilin Flp